MLARSVQLLSKDAIPGSEDSETLVERLDGVGNVLGRWIITWGENGEGSSGHVALRDASRRELLSFFPL